ncbi:MAG: mannonate dehydratase [Bdellovibrionota bacterium]
MSSKMAVEGRALRSKLRQKSFCGIVVRWFGPGDAALGTKSVFGPADPITLADICQNPHITGVVSALHGVKPGTIWDQRYIRQLKQNVEGHGLDLVGIESLWPGEEVICGGSDRERYADAFAESADNIGAEGIGFITYNLITGAGDWMRNASHIWPTGGVATAYNRTIPQAASSLSTTFDADGRARLSEIYRRIGKNGVWDNAAWFLDRVAPAFRKYEGALRLALHPDDPPEDRGPFPTAFSTEEDLAHYLSMCDEPWSGLCFCTGSLSSRADNDLVRMVRRFHERIVWGHFRSVVRTETGFIEAPHELGDTPLLECLKELRKVNWRGDIRPDHGLLFQGDRAPCDGYGFQDRILRAASLLYGWSSALQSCEA